MIKVLTATIATTIILGAALYGFGTETEVMASASQIGQKGDRLDSPLNEISCGDWPYYHQACLRDLKKPDSHARKVRIILLDRHRRPTFLKSLTKMTLAN
jgi:hypothetical protein